MRRLLIAVVFLVGCGSETQTPRDMLTGIWVISNGNNAVGMTFADPEQYSFQRLQLVSSNSANIEIERGDFAWSDTELFFLPKEASCTGVYPAWSVGYAVTRTRLTISDATGAVAFERTYDDGAGGLIITTGCFAQDGTFSPSPVAPVSNQ